ncbi:hypothetical protein HU200_036915 [Digitaria exilis]|uniref:Uncharacterized protein n=1 Tax=Digitaria exilis TaxID=1010633 RepID=A0A835BKN9_9POAL|nr:hypothetical protein HU200_036915 [Digitaria exilis]CAB3477954.1 unnamed protein product [Digitaria exilis]
MGNTEGRRSNSKNDAEESSRRVVVVVTSSSRRVEQTARAGRRPPAGGVPRAGGGVAPPATGTAVTVKLVMTRKDAVALAARLDHAQRQSARARKARMDELKGELRAGGASPASCRVACWSPQLASIKESR